MYDSMDMFILTAFQDLIAGVKKSVTGDLASLLLSLLMPPPEHDAYRLQQAMGVSTGHTYMLLIAFFSCFYVCRHKSLISYTYVLLCVGFRHR